MEIVNIKEGYTFKMLPGKTLAFNSNTNSFFCPFCYNPASEAESKCGTCGKNFPELVYYHGDDDTWIASGNE